MQTTSHWHAHCESRTYRKTQRNLWGQLLHSKSGLKSSYRLFDITVVSYELDFPILSSSLRATIVPSSSTNTKDAPKLVQLCTHTKVTQIQLKRQGQEGSGSNICANYNSCAENITLACTLREQSVPQDTEKSVGPTDVQQVRVKKLV